MFSTARAVVTFLLLVVPAAGVAQTGPSEPQVIAAASTARINAASRKLAGQVIATLRVGENGKVLDVKITENTAEPAFEPQLIKVLQSARFRPAIDESGKVIEASIDMKLELRPSTGPEPKPVAAKLNPKLTDLEKARIRRMKCSDFVWEWDVIRDEASDATATEFMPRIAVLMYAALRSEGGEYVDAKVWKESAKALKHAVDKCRNDPPSLFFDVVFKSVMDEAVPK
jgi:TonB family protein